MSAEIKATGTIETVAKGRTGIGWVIVVVQAILKFARKKPLGALGGAMALLAVSTALFAPWIATHNPKQIIDLSFMPPSFSTSIFDWGTDWLGRDVFSRVVYGARLSLYVGLLSPLWGTTTGCLLGLMQGYWGGKAFDTWSQRVIEALQSIPNLILAMTFMAVFGPSLRNVVLAVGIGFIAGSSRLMRSVTLSQRENAYIDAARAIGASPWRIIFVHLLPNTSSLYLTLISLQVGAAILAESSLSFLGLGAGPDVPSWGGMITLGTKQALAGIPFLALFPGMAIAITTYGFNLFGDGLRDVMDPRLRGRGR